MFLKKICYFIFAIFLILNLYENYEDSNSVQYVFKNDTFDDILFSFCIEFNQELLKNFTNSNNEYQFTVKDLLDYTCFKFFSKSTCTNLIDLERSYLFNYHSCLIFNNTHFDILIRNLSSIDFHIFSISGYKSQIYFYENIFSNKNTAFKLNNKSDPFTLNLNYYKIYYLKAPFQTNCFNYSNDNANFQTKELIYSRASFLYECFKIKSNSRSLSYYYSRRDDELLIVTQSDLDQFKRIRENRITDKYLTADLKKKCMNNCNKISCHFQYYSIDEYQATGQTEFSLKYDLKEFQAIPSTTRYQFIINFISLIVLFLNVSFFETIPYLIKKIVLVYFKKYLTQFKRNYWLVKLIIFILCLIIVINLSIFRIIDYKNADYNQLEAFNFPTEIIPFYLMICIPVQILIYNNTNGLDKNVEMNLLNTKSFTEIENLTNFSKFEKNLDRIYIQYAGIERPVEPKIDKTKIVFKHINYEFKNLSRSNFLLRCFKIDFDFKELRYEMLYSLSKLIVILNFNWYIVYPLAKNQNLSTFEPYLNSNAYFRLKKYEKKFNCLDYSRNRSFYNFSSLTNRIDHCVNDGHLKKYNNLTIQSVIYKEMIPSKYKLNNVYFNYNLSETIHKKCAEQSKEHHCFTQIFRTTEAKPINQVNNKFSMYLYYPEYLVNDNLVLTMSDLLLNNLFSFESIFIGLNIGKILFILIILLKKYKLNRILNYYNYLKLIILLIGLSIHFYLIINDILNDKYIFQQDFSHSSKDFQPPNIILCLKFNQNDIDYNYKQTTNYLDDLTKDLNLNLFQNISMIDRNYEEVVFESNKNKTSNYFKKMYTLYFLNLKCFEFIFRPIDDSRYLNFFNQLNFINIKFNKTKILEYFNRTRFEFYFFSKERITHELNGVNEITINYDNNSFIKINQDLTILQIKEKFSFIKNPFFMFYESVNLDDTTDYINKLIEQFQVFYLKTKRIPTISKDPRYKNDNDGNLEIDDELFDQYYNQIKNVTDYNAIKSLNFKRELYFTRITEVKKQFDEDYDLKIFFELDFKKYNYTNRDNHSKFIISILNCLNIWLNFCCFDLYIYLQKFCNLIYKIYQLILIFKFYLNQKRLSLLA